MTLKLRPRTTKECAIQFLIRTLTITELFQGNVASSRSRLGPVHDKEPGKVGWLKFVKVQRDLHALYHSLLIYSRSPKIFKVHAC